MRHTARLVLIAFIIAILYPPPPAGASVIEVETYYFDNCSATNQCGYQWHDRDGNYYSEGTLDGTWKEVVRWDTYENTVLSDKYYYKCFNSNTWVEYPTLGGFCCTQNP